MEMLRKYKDAIDSNLDAALNGNADTITGIKDEVKKAMRGARRIFLFGSMKLQSPVDEYLLRAGGFASISPMFEEPLMVKVSAKSAEMIKKVDGYAHVILHKYGADAGDVIFIFGRDGKDVVTEEVSAAAKEKGLIVVDVSNRQCAQMASLCDYSLDLSCRDDLPSEFYGTTNAAPMAFNVGSIILNGIFAQAAVELNAGQALSGCSDAGA